MAVDVLQHHDGAVHQHADAQRQAAQGHDVEGEVAGRHQGDGDQDGDGDGAADHQGAPEAAQEQPHHQHRQRGAAEGRRRGVAQRAADVARLVVDRGDLHRFRDQPALLQLGELTVDAIHHAHRVGLGLFLDGELDGGQRVQADAQARLLVALVNVGQRSQGQGDALAAVLLQFQRQLFQGLEVAESAPGLDRDLHPGQAQSATGDVAVLALQEFFEVQDVQPAGRQVLLVGEHLDLPAQPAGHLGRRHAGYGDQPLAEGVVHPLAQLHRVEPAGADGELGGGQLGGIALVDDRRLDGVGQEAPCPVEAGGGVAQGGIDVVAVGEIEIHGAAPLARCGADVDGTLGDGQLLLELARHLVLHDLCRHPGIVDAHGDAGIDDVRQQVDLEAAQGEEPQHHHRQGEHDHGDGVVQRPARDATAGWSWGGAVVAGVHRPDCSRNRTVEQGLPPVGGAPSRRRFMTGRSLPRTIPCRRRVPAPNVRGRKAVTTSGSRHRAR